MFTFGWLTVTAEDLAVWQQFPNAAFTLVQTAKATDAGEEFRLGAFELQENPSLNEKLSGVCRKYQFRAAGPSRPQCAPLVFHPLVGFRWRRIRWQRNGGARRENCFGLGVACDGRRPRPIDAPWPDRLNRKSGTGAPQGDGSLTSQTVRVDHRRRT